MESAPLSGKAPSPAGVAREGECAPGRRARSAAPGALPCLYTNNGAGRLEEEGSEHTSETWQRLSSVHRKTAHNLFVTVQSLARTYGRERIGFLTLTFKDPVEDMREASRRFKSLTKHVLDLRYSEWVRIAERQKQGRLHYHLVVVLDKDIRSGANFEEFARAEIERRAGRPYRHLYRSGNENLRGEWAFWRKTAKRFRFGRCNILPAKSTVDAIARYMGKYISKHIGSRELRDKGARLVAYKRGTARGSSKFMWASTGADLWRWKVKVFCQAMGFTESGYEEKLREGWGVNWVHVLGPAIKSIKLAEYPTWEHFEKEYPEAALSVRDEYLGPIEGTGFEVEEGKESAESLFAAVSVALTEKARLLRRKQEHRSGVPGLSSARSAPGWRTWAACSSTEGAEE